MDSRDLIRMANQITAFFAPYPKSEAVDGIAKHVHLFWDPRMRNQLKTIVDDGGEGLEPLFLEAAHDYFKGPKSPASKAAPPKSP
jgi:formate dehydrogenase subunit delta